MHLWLHFVKGKDAVVVGMLCCAWFAAFFLYGAWERTTHRDLGAALVCVIASAGFLAAAAFMRRLGWPSAGKPAPSADRPTPIE